MLMLFLKIVFKLVFKLFSRLEGSLEPGSTVKNGKAEMRGELAARKIGHGLKITLQGLEEKLNQRVSQFGEQPQDTDLAPTPEDIIEIEALQAQIAELRADIRSLLRVMPTALDATPVNRPVMHD